VLLSSFSLHTAQASSVSSATNAEVGLAHDLIYFVFPDRYLNGDRTNDLGNGYDPTSTAFFHGGDLKGLTGSCSSGDNGLARIKALGFTAVWLTPLVVQQLATSSGAGYHGYWGVDFLNVEPHLGTNSDLEDLAKCAKKLNLKLILDIVTNHTGDVIQYLDKSAYIPADKVNAKNPSWLNDLQNYHNVGDMSRCWGDGSCTQLGDFYGLDDLATEKPTVYNGWIDVYSQWIKKYGFEGFRVDTARHVDENFFKNWSPGINEAAASVGINKFTIFGEVYMNDPIELMGFIRQNKIQTVLDFPFQHAAAAYASGNSDSASMTNLFDYDDMYTSADSSANNLVTFLGNHDMGRIGFLMQGLKNQPAADLLPRTELAHALMYFTRGIPTVYYGDEVGMTGSGSGNDQKARQDMFPTQVSEWKTELRIGSQKIGSGSAFDLGLNHPIEKYIIELSKLRSQHPGLSNQQMQVRYSSGPLLVISKRDPIENREYLVAFNNSKKAITATVTTSTSGKWKSLLGNNKLVVSGSKVSLTVPALSTGIFQAMSAPVAAKSASGKIAIKEDFISGFYKATLSIKSTDLLQVNFLVQKDSTGEWLNIGTDSSAPYQVYLNPAELQGVKSFSVRATAVNSAGKTFSIAPATFAVR
jgi:glycosidase